MADGARLNGVAALVLIGGISERQCPRARRRCQPTRCRFVPSLPAASAPRPSSIPPRSSTFRRRWMRPVTEPRFRIRH
jgi:hypothetical protein